MHIINIFFNLYYNTPFQPIQEEIYHITNQPLFLISKLLEIKSSARPKYSVYKGHHFIFNEITIQIVIFKQ